MDRAVVRSIQVFFTVFLVLAVLTASGRVILADGADHSLQALANIVIGDLLVLFVAFGLIWVLPNRVMRGEQRTTKKTSRRAAVSSAPAPAVWSETVNSLGDAADAGVSTTSNPGKPAASTAAQAPSTFAVSAPATPLKAGSDSWSANAMILVAIVPAVLILVIGTVLYFH